MSGATHAGSRCSPTTPASYRPSTATSKPPKSVIGPVSRGFSSDLLLPTLWGAQGDRPSQAHQALRSPRQGQSSTVHRRQGRPTQMPRLSHDHEPQAAPQAPPLRVRDGYDADRQEGHDLLLRQLPPLQVQGQTDRQDHREAVHVLVPQEGERPCLRQTSIVAASGAPARARPGQTASGTPVSAASRTTT